MRQALPLAVLCLLPVAFLAFRSAHNVPWAMGSPVATPCWALMTFAVAAFIGSGR